MIKKKLEYFHLKGEIDSEEEEIEDKKSAGKKMNGIENGVLKDDQNSKSNDEDDDSDLDDDDDDDFDEYDKTLLENYTSCIDSNDEVDEFVIFRDTLQSK